MVSKTKDETAGVANEEFDGLKTRMYSYLADHNSEHKKAKDVNRNVVATLSHNRCKDVLMNKKCLRHSITRIQSKDHSIGTTRFLCLALMRKYSSKIGCDGLALGY